MIIIIGILMFAGFYFVQEYKIPQLISEDYNCEKHPGFISESNPFFFESSQHYVNRKGKVVQKQIEEVCNNG